MGGSPDRTVQKIKNMVYLDPTGQKKNESRDEYLGELFNSSSFGRMLFCQ